MKTPKKYKLGNKAYYLEELAERFHITAPCVYLRIKRGWTLKDFEKGCRVKAKAADSFRQKWHRMRMHANQHPNYIIKKLYDDFEAYKDFLVKIGWKEGLNLFRKDLSKPLSIKNYVLSEKKKIGDSKVSQLAKGYGISHQGVYARFKAGWTEEDFKRGYRKYPKDKDPYIKSLMERYNLSKNRVLARLKRGWVEEDFERGYKRYNLKQKYFGKYSARELAVKFGLNQETVKSRIRQGWTLEDFRNGRRKNRQNKRLIIDSTLNTCITNYIFEKKDLFGKILEEFLKKHNLSANEASVEEKRQVLSGTEYVDYYLTAGGISEHILRLEAPVESK